LERDNVAEVTCFKCHGKGFLPQFSGIKGGVCFTCHGKGVLNPLSFQRLEMHSDDNRKFQKFLTGVSTKDLIATVRELTREQFQKLGEKNGRLIKYELHDRAEALGVEVDSLNLSKTVKNTEEALNKLEKEMPKPWEKTGYGKFAEEVPVHWLTKFQGNSLRRDDKEMDKFAEELKKDGLKDPVMVIIGQEDRKVSIGEGNHRTFAFLRAGLDKVPVRVVRNRTNPGGVFYDKMHTIPTDDYVKGDLKPSEVFDTYYDGKDLTEYTPENLQKLGHTKLDINIKDNYFVPRFGKSGFIKEYYSKQKESVPKSLIDSINKALAELKDLDVDSLGTEVIMKNEADLEWIDSEKGIASLNAQDFLKGLHDRIEQEKRWQDLDNDADYEDDFDDDGE
jgi:hypothetical protein